MTIRLAMVPKPGRSRNGNHSTSTTALTSAVDQPSEKPVWRATPWAKTVHGVAPQCDWTSNPSPNPKSVSPLSRGASILGRISHGLVARHGVTGILWLSFMIRATLVAAVSNVGGYVARVVPLHPPSNQPVGNLAE